MGIISRRVLPFEEASKEETQNEICLLFGRYISFSIGSFYRSLLTFFILTDIVNNNREIISLYRFVADVVQKMEGRR